MAAEDEDAAQLHGREHAGAHRAPHIDRAVVDGREQQPDRTGRLPASAVICGRERILLHDDLGDGVARGRERFGQRRIQFERARAIPDGVGDLVGDVADQVGDAIESREFGVDVLRLSAAPERTWVASPAVVGVRQRGAKL